MSLRQQVVRKSSQGNIALFHLPPRKTIVFRLWPTGNGLKGERGNSVSLDMLSQVCLFASVDKRVGLRTCFLFIFFIVFFFSFIFISWRLMTSQHCSGFCHTLTWISHGVTCTCFLNFIYFLNFRLGDNCFTMLYWFLLYNNQNQL